MDTRKWYTDPPQKKQKKQKKTSPLPFMMYHSLLLSHWSYSCGTLVLTVCIWESRHHCIVIESTIKYWDNITKQPTPSIIWFSCFYMILIIIVNKNDDDKFNNCKLANQFMLVYVFIMTQLIVDVLYFDFW